MGCDIHLLVEKKVGDKWVMVDRIEHPSPARERNYYIFGKMASVRGGDGFAPRGLPDDLSDSGKLFAEEWDGDGHHYSYLSMFEALHIFVTCTDGLSDYDKKYPAMHFFDLYFEERYDDENGPIPYDDYRVVFWFDN